MQLQRKLFYLGILPILGCAGSSSTFQPPDPSLTIDPGLRPGDAIQVNIWQESDLSGSFSVDARGYVVLPLLGEREVIGTPIPDLEQTLVEEYRAFLENPSVQVTVLRRIAIFGEVRNPNLYMVDATVTLRDALAMAGGVLSSGNRNQVRLLRNGEVIIASLDLNQTIGEMPIQSGDQIEVGEQAWAARNRSVLLTVFGAATTVVTAIIWRR